LNIFNRFNLGTKLMASFILVAVIMIIVAVVGYQNMQIIHVGAQMLYNDRLTPIKQLGAAESAVYKLRGDVFKAALVPSLRQTIGEDAQKSIDEVNQELTNYNAIHLQPAETKQLDIFKAAWKDYQQIINSAVEKLKAGDTDGAVAILSETNAATTRETMDTALGNLIKINQLAADDVYKQGETIFADSSLGLLIVTLIGLGIAIALGRISTLSIIRPLSLVKQASQQIARSDLDALSRKFESLAKGDLTRSFYLSTQPVQINSKDEIGELGGAFNEMIARLQEMGQSFSVMVSSLRTLVGNLSQNAQSLSAASDTLAQAAAEAGQTTRQISTTMQQVASGINQQTDSISKTAGSVEQMGRAIDGVASGAQEQSLAVSRAAAITTQITSAIQNVSASAQTGAQGAAQAAETARSGARTVDETIRGMQSIKQKVNVSVEKVREMGLRSGQIGAIVETIDDIASQTNLLALNAAIEAARAGEHGKGFAVVADEVRKLAERSSAATKEIGALVKGIQTTVNEAVAAMDEGAKEVENGVVSAGLSDKALADILKAVELVTRQVEGIATEANKIGASSSELIDSMDSVSAVVEQNTASTEEMAAGSSEVTSAVENIASVSEENSAAVEEVSASTSEMNAQVEKVTAAAETMTEMARNLQALVAQFNTDGDMDIQKNVERGRQEAHEWVENLEGMLAGEKQVNESAFRTHKECMYGLWHYSTGEIVLGQLEEYKALGEPHEQFHQAVRDAITAYKKGSSGRQQAEEKTRLARKLSQQVIEKLNRLEKRGLGEN
jgi:methyl-accepting chemotaxis protein